MKRALVLLLALALLAAPAFAADKVELIWTAQATNTSKSVQTAGYGEAQITVWAASGSPDAFLNGPHKLLSIFSFPCNSCLSYSTPNSSDCSVRSSHVVGCVRA